MYVNIRKNYLKTNTILLNLQCKSLNLRKRKTNLSYLIICMLILLSHIHNKLYVMNSQQTMHALICGGQLTACNWNGIQVMVLNELIRSTMILYIAPKTFAVFLVFANLTCSTLQDTTRISLHSLYFVRFQCKSNHLSSMSALLETRRTASRLRPRSSYPGVVVSECLGLLLPHQSLVDITARESAPQCHHYQFPLRYTITGMLMFHRSTVKERKKHRPVGYVNVKRRKILTQRYTQRDLNEEISKKQDENTRTILIISR